MSAHGATGCLWEAGLRIEHGDCREVMARLEAEGVQFDGCVSDPPYHLHSIVKRFGGENAAAAKSNGATGVYARQSKGFMGKTWDGGDVAFDPDTWRAVYRLLKPGAHVIAFSHVTKIHRLACALEDAGFEIRDQFDWVYGQGKPNSHAQSGRFTGWGTSLKPCKEPAVLARKPFKGSLAENLETNGVGALNIEGCRVESDSGGTRWPGNLMHDGSPEVLAHFPDNAGMHSGILGTEPSAPHAHVFNPMSGREAFDKIDASGSAARFFKQINYGPDDDWGARMVYCPKAPQKERVYRCSVCDHRAVGPFKVCKGCGRRMTGEDAEGEVLNHPTVKPVDLMAYMLKLVIPAGGTVLDPFAGTGSTGIAAMRNGIKPTLIELEQESIEDIKFRLTHLSGRDTPLFASAGE